jgi:hypothetical protein
VLPASQRRAQTSCMPQNKREQVRSSDKRTSPKIPAPGRDTSGRFLKGVCGNAGGRPVVAIEVKELARQHGAAAIARLACLMHSSDPQTCIAAAKALLDRGFGKPTQSIEVDANVTNQPVTEYPSMYDMNPIDVARAYQEMIHDTTNSIKFREPEHSAEWYAERNAQRAHEKELAEIAARASPPPARPQAPSAAGRSPDPVAAAPEPRLIAQPKPRLVAPSPPLDPDERVISVVEQEDMALRHQRPPRIVT